MGVIVGDFKDGRYYYVIARMTKKEYTEFARESKKEKKKVSKKKKR